MDSRINYCGLGEGSTILFKDRPRVTGAPKLIRPGMHKCFSKTRSEPERRASRHWSHPCKSPGTRGDLSKMKQEVLWSSIWEKITSGCKKACVPCQWNCGRRSLQKHHQEKRMSFNMGQDERKATELGHTCLTHPLTYSPPFQGVKWQMPKGGYLCLLWILVFHSTPFKLKFCSNLIRRNGQGTYKS